MIQTEELVGQLRQKAREHRQEARRCMAAVTALLQPQKRQGRPVNPNRALLEAFKRSGLTYQQVGSAVGISYRLASWIIRGTKHRPELAMRIFEALNSPAQSENSN